MEKSKKIPICPQCGQMSVKKNGHRKDKSQKYKCKLCNENFVQDTEESIYFKLERTAIACKRKENVLSCPLCESKENVIKDGKRKNNDNEEIQHYFCKECRKSFNADTIQKLIKETDILNAYLGYVDNMLGKNDTKPANYIHPYFLKKIAIRIFGLENVIYENEKNKKRAENNAKDKLRKITLKYEEKVTAHLSSRRKKLEESHYGKS